MCVCASSREKMEKKEDDQKNLKSYQKKVAEVLRNCLPQPGLCHLYCFQCFESDYPSHKLFNDLGGRMAILSSSRLPHVCPFRLATGVEVKLVEVSQVKVGKDELEKLNDFHQYLIEEVILRFEKEPEEAFEFDFKNPRLGLLVVPLENGHLHDFTH